MRPKVVRLILLFVGFVALVYKTPLFKFIPKQYQIQDDTVQQAPTPEATASAAPQTPAQKVDSLILKPSPTPSTNAFAQLSVLENYPAGYRLIYPAGFTIDYSFGKIEIRPPSGGGLVSVYIKDDAFDVQTFADGTTAEQTKLLSAAAKLVTDTFEFISGPGYDEKSAQERFGN